MDLPTELLRTFVAAADAQSYTTAAALIHRTQSAVSMQMKRLEEGIGHPLFRRYGRAMKLTPSGQTLLHYARRMLNLHDEALSALTRPELSGHVRLGVTDDYAQRLLPQVLARFATVYPRIQVNVVCKPGGGYMAALDKGELDLVLQPSGDLPKQGEIIFREQMVWATSIRHIAHEQTPLPIAVYNQPCIFYKWAIRSLEKIGCNYHITYSCPGFEGIMAAVRSGLAVAPVGQSTLCETIRKLGSADGFSELPILTISLIKPPGRLRPEIESLATHVKECFREISPMEHCMGFSSTVDGAVKEASKIRLTS